MLGLQGGLPLQGFQAKVGREHSRQRKQTASQYLLSLPNTQRMQKSCGASRHKKVPRLFGACGLVRRPKREVPECAGLGQLQALGVSFLLFSPPKTIMVLALQVFRACQFFFHSGECSYLFLSPCSHYALTQTHHLRNECLHLPLNQSPCLQPLVPFNIFCAWLLN